VTEEVRYPGAAPQRDAQRHPVQKLHGDERLALVFRDFVYGANVGMVQGRRGARLSAKPFQRLRIFCSVLGQKLQRDKATEFGVLGFIDQTHPTTA